MMRGKLLLGLVVIVAFLAGMGGGLSLSREKSEAPAYIADRVLVKFREDTPESIRNEVYRRHGGTVVDTIPEIGVQVVKLRGGRVRETVRAYRMEEPDIEFAEPDYIRETTLTPDDPSFDKQWGLMKIQASQAWDITPGSAAVKIAILDTGVDDEHEDLARKTVAEKNFTSGKDTDDEFGHGSHVAGIAAAMSNNRKGVSGININSTVMNVKVISDNGTGDDAGIARGIIWAANNGARVISMSFGGAEPSETVEAAIDFAWSNGVVIVASAGNANSDQPQFPAFFENVIAVAATDNVDARARFSNFGSWVDIAAPGVDIFSTLPHEKSVIGENLGVRSYGSLSGTSMAAPFVSGVAALIIAQHPDWTNAQVRAKLEASIDPTSGFPTSIGRVNALKAVLP